MKTSILIMLVILCTSFISKAQVHDPDNLGKKPDTTTMVVTQKVADSALPEGLSQSKLISLISNNPSKISCEWARTNSNKWQLEISVVANDSTTISWYSGEVTNRSNKTRKSLQVMYSYVNQISIPFSYQKNPFEQAPCNQMVEREFTRQLRETELTK